MDVILGIDAAWTCKKPSGVAVVVRQTSKWRCAAVTPNYESLLAQASGVPLDWNTKRFSGSLPQAKKLLEAANHLAGGHVNIVTIDMPVATIAIQGRRAADQAISKRFGRQGCSTHTPGIERPGSLSACLSRQFEVEGYPIATTSDSSSTRPRLVEVYPHPALLKLLGREKRVPYKVSRSGQYWPSCSVPERIDKLLSEFETIHGELEDVFGEIAVPLPKRGSVKTLTALKRYEDALDALICAWVGTQYLDQKTVAFGDESAAIWCPE